MVVKIRFLENGPEEKGHIFETGKTDGPNLYSVISFHKIVFTRKLKFLYSILTISRSQNVLYILELT